LNNRDRYDYLEYQELNANLTSISGLTPTDSFFIVGDGSFFVTESGNTAKHSLGLGTQDSPTFSSLALADDLTLLGGTNSQFYFRDATILRGDIRMIYDGETFTNMRFHSVAALNFSALNAINIMPNNDNDDFIEISTSANQTTINFVGQDGRITAEGGTIDFVNEHLKTTGLLTDGTNSLTIAQAKTAYDNRITSATAPLDITSHVISIPVATTSANGYLSSTDWNTFNGKLSDITGESFADLSDIPVHPGATKVLETTADGYAWINTPAGGGGGVSGPVSSTEDAIARWADASGDVLDNSTVLINDSGDLTIPLGGELITIGTSGYGLKIGQYGAGANALMWPLPGGDPDDYIAWLTVDGANLYLWSRGDMLFQTQQDSSDYIKFTEVNAGIPRITTVGSCNLEIQPDGGTVDLGYCNLTNVDLLRAETVWTKHLSAFTADTMFFGDWTAEGAINFDSQNMTNVNIDSGTIDGVALGATCTQTEWDTAYTHSQDNTQAHSDYLLNSGNDETSGTITAAGFTTAGTVNTAELFNSAGDLKIEPDVQGDVVLFGDTNVGDAVDGKKFTIWRKAAEGNNYFSIYTDNWQRPILYSNGNLQFWANGSIILFCNPGGDVRAHLGDAAGSNEFYVEDSGANKVASIDSDGNAMFLGSYGQVIGGTNTDLYIDNAGKIGPNPSAVRFKENIRNLDNSELIYQLRPIMYDRKDGSAKDAVGLIAEEVAEVMPKSVVFERDITWEKPLDTGGPESTHEIESIKQTDVPFAVNYSSLIVPMLKEIQKLREEVNILKQFLNKE